MEIFIKESLKIINLMEKAFINLNVEIYILARFQMAKRMKKEDYNIQLEATMKDNF